MTVSAFSSLSLDPPLVIVCIAHAASMHGALVEASHFAVNILATDQEALSRRFASEKADRFDGVGYHRGQSGVALLEGALAAIECRVVATHAGGDHTIFVGEVETGTVHETEPLLYYRGGYARLSR
jgi:flavin reductase (DIM6/NTAB) family NADH-FMN oxidoreductase RutF